MQCNQSKKRAEKAVKDLVFVEREQETKQPCTSPTLPLLAL